MPLAGFPFLSGVISALFLIICLWTGLATSDQATFSLSGIVELFRESPAFFPVLIFAILVPVGVYYACSIISNQLKQKQQIIDQEEERMQQIHKFTQELIHDNLEVDFTRLGDDDHIGNSLISLRDTLRVNRENNLKLKAEEEQRTWTAEGLARISTILRNILHDPEQLAFNVIKELTKYVNAIQGGFYKLDDSNSQNRFFDLVAFFAYDRRKFTDQQIRWGDGLIGTCAMERKPIHLKSLPENYINVTSGLGEANPDSLLIVPMLFEDKLYGVLEFATFNKFEAKHISLIEQAAESIASTLAAVNSSMTTSRLLEESRTQTQALTSHEEEMRQNMEELQATQEEASRQTERFIKLEEAIDQSLMRAEFTAEGRLLSANALFYTKFEYPAESNILGKSIYDFISRDSQDQFHDIWKKLKKNKIPYNGFLKHVTHDSNELWTMVSLMPAHDGKGPTGTAIMLAMDVSGEVRKGTRD